MGTGVLRASDTPDPSVETISSEEWVQMSKGIRSRTPGDYLLGRNSREADLVIPTVLREKERLADQGEG